VAEAADGRVAQNLEQPGSKIRAWDELLAKAERAEVRILDQVLGVGRVPRQAQGRPIERVDVLQRLFIGEARLRGVRWLSGL